MNIEQFSVSRQYIALCIKFSLNLGKLHFAIYFVLKVVLEIAH